MSAPLAWEWLGRAPYRSVWDLQEALRERLLAGDEGAERLLFVEHAPVITLGRSADRANVVAAPEVLAARGVEVVATSRGGDVTYHGPGQLVIYPVVRLRRGLVAHLEAIAGAIVEVLAGHGVAGAAWRRDPAGVWIDDEKIAACGVHVRRRVAIHGFSLNVTEEALAGFRLIVPCGLAGRRVTTAAAHASESLPPLADLAREIAENLCARWDRVPVCSCDRGTSR